MSQLIITAVPHSALVEAGHMNAARVLSFPDRRQAQESLLNPCRGIVWGGLISIVLWAAIIFTARELWLFLR
jgi:hypothetical protein